MAGSSTAVSTLVLALEARNNSAAAFAELRGQLRENVSAAQQAGRQIEEAARQSQARQLLDVRQRTAQELLELRQKTAYEVQQIQQGAAGKTAAERRAAADRVQMLRQDAAQAALVMRQGAEEQALAIRGTTQAQVAASREQVAVVEQAARVEAEAMRASQSAQAAAARESAASERAALAVAGRPDAAEGGRGAGLPGMGLLASMGRFGAQMALWNVGYGAMNRLTTAVGGFSAGLVTANSRMEQFHQSFSVLLGSKAGGAAATQYLTHFALTAPATLDETMSAGETVASLGDNMTEVMPAIGNVAAALGVDLPRAAQAFADAQQGRFQMMQMTLRTSKEELVKYGLQLDATGHVLNNSFVPAFERMAKEKYGQGMAMQMDTVAGVFSNVQDALENLQRILGKPLFALVRKDLEDFMHLLQSPQAQIVAHAIGEGLGHAFAAVGEGVRAAAPVVWAGINLIVGAWKAAQPAIRAAVSVITGAMDAIGTVMQQAVLPVVYTALGQMIVWWADNAAKVAAVIDFIKGVLGGFGKQASVWMVATLTQLQGIWQVGWAAISGVVSLVLDVITGNWAKLGPDLNHMTTQMALGVSNILKGLVENTILILYSLREPFNALMHAVYAVSRSLAGMIFDVWNNLPTLIMQSINSILTALPRVGTLLAKWASDLGKTLRDAITGHHPHAGGGGSSGFGLAGTSLLGTVARDTRTARQKFVDMATFGWAPEQNLTFGKTPQQAIADVEAWWKQNIQDPIARTDTPGMQASARNAPDFTKLGQETLRGWVDALKKSGGLFDLGRDMPQWLKDLTAGAGTWSGGGGTPPFDLRSLRGAQRDAIEAAQTHFQIDLARGTITQAQGIKDIGAILTAMHKAGATDDQLTLTLLQDTKTLDEQLLGQAQKQFDFDAGVAHPARQKLHHDELAYLGLYAQTPGITPLDVSTMRQQWDARIDQIMGGKKPPHVDPYKQAALALAAGAGYGQTTVTMGPVRDTLVAHLQAQLREMKAQNARAERQIGLLEAELVEQHRAGGLLEGIFHNTAGTHQAAQQTARHTQPRPTSGAHGFSQRTGMPVPV